MNLIVLLGDYKVFWLLFLALVMVVGYFIRRRDKQVLNSKVKAFEENKQKLIKLEEDLKESNAKNKALNEELGAIKQRLNIVAGQQPKSENGGGLQEDDSNNRLDEISNSETQRLVDSTIGQVNQGGIVEPPKKSLKFEALMSDNLQIVEGIGPKMESVLKENGVINWLVLSEQKKEDLRGILELYGNKYKIIDPDSWAEQASYAATGSWSQLVSMQKGLDAGKYIGQGETTAKVEKVMVKLGIIKEYRQDDFKAIEGIGPKIAELLNREGINTWQELAMTELRSLQNILDKAGKRYQLSDPRTWPKQAALAAEGRYDELSDYQELLKGGV